MHHILPVLVSRLIAFPRNKLLPEQNLEHCHYHQYTCDVYIAAVYLRVRLRLLCSEDALCPQMGGVVVQLLEDAMRVPRWTHSA